MPVAKLFVEGALDVQVLAPILQGSPLLQEGGPKGSLRPRARTERRENEVAAGYLRDRDFDFDPPADLSRPTVDAEDAGLPWGWRWCRHEIENYLIDPAVVSQAMDWRTGYRRRDCLPRGSFVRCCAIGSSHTLKKHSHRCRNGTA